MSRHELLEFSTAELLVEALATRIGDLLTEGVRKRLRRQHPYSPVCPFSRDGTALATCDDFIGG